MLRLKHAQNSNSSRRAQLNSSWERVLRDPAAGFIQIPQLSEDWMAIGDRLQELLPSERGLVLGIGGSSLGPQVVQSALRAPEQMELFFLESPDPTLWDFHRGFSGPEWKSKHILVVSKSGGTLETLAWVEKFAAIDPNWLENSQVTVITSPGEGALQRWAKREGVPCLWIPPNVGGRFSVLTAVGMFPAALLGLSLADFQKGAEWSLQNPDLATQMSLEMLAAFDDQRWITQMWNYSGSLRMFGEWWQQLWGESLAKLIDRRGGKAQRVSTPMSCMGPRDQHSLVQQLMEGAPDKNVIVTRVKGVENSNTQFKGQIFPELPFAGKESSLGRILGAEAEAFERSLSDARIPFCTVEIEQLNEKSLGALFMFWQMVVAQLGEYFAVDTFNQPGVERGKKYAAELLK